MKTARGREPGVGATAAAGELMRCEGDEGNGQGVEDARVPSKSTKRRMGSYDI